MADALRYLVSAMLTVVAVIHLLPLSGVLGSKQLSTLYGLPFSDPSLVILMRHRAVLFGLLGAFLLVAAFRPAWQPAAFVTGFVSVVSFLWLCWSAGDYSSQVARVFAADVVALVCLVIGSFAYAATNGNA
ncbi:MAG: phosphopantetheine adenylyltransferase [Candidatus Binatia bacterium]